jgi:hypothetical protein
MVGKKLGRAGGWPAFWLQTSAHRLMLQCQIQSRNFMRVDFEACPAFLNLENLE